MNLELLHTIIYTFIIKNRFASCGRGVMLAGFRRLIGAQYMYIGTGTKIGKDAIMTIYQQKTFPNPNITIGQDCNIGEFCHITAINNIKIGNNVLTGRWVTITDNSHGTTTLEDLKISPLKRKVISKGPVEIEDNVWIGDKATILPNVHIGFGAVIAANTVVTKDVPAYAVVAGNPAKIVKNNNI